MATLTLLDYVIIVVYLVGVIGLGMWIGIRRREADDIFLAGRSLAWGSVGLSIFITNIGPYHIVSTCGEAYQSGIVGACWEWLQWAYIFILAYLFIPFYMRTKVSTMPEFISRRFGKGAYGFLSLYMLFTTFIIWLGLVLFTGAKFLSLLTGWNFFFCAIALTTVAASFTVVGGLLAVVITDVAQAILLVIVSILVNLIMFDKVGGISGFIEKIPSEEFMTLFRSPSHYTFPWPAVLLSTFVSGIWFWCIDQTIVQRVLGAKNLQSAQKGAWLAAVMKILPPFLFMMPGIILAMIHSQPIDDKDRAYLVIVTQYLPAGMTGLIISILMAGLISTLDSALNSFSTIFTLDVYVKYFRREASRAETIWAGRVVTVVAAILAVLLGIYYETRGEGIFVLSQIIISYAAPPLTAVFLVGVLWKRATTTAGFLGLVVGSIASIGTGAFALHFSAGPNAIAFFERPANHFYLAFGVFAAVVVFMIIVSLLTKNRPGEQDFPTVQETIRTAEGRFSKGMWAAWAGLAVVMFGLYWVFN